MRTGVPRAARGLAPCRCGGEPERLSRRTRRGMKWFVRCTACGRRTHLHRPNGGDIGEWNNG